MPYMGGGKEWIGVRKSADLCQIPSKSANPRVKFFVKSVDQWLYLLKSVYSKVRWITKAKLTTTSRIFRSETGVRQKNKYIVLH